MKTENYRAVKLLPITSMLIKTLENYDMERMGKIISNKNLTPEWANINIQQYELKVRSF